MPPRSSQKPPEPPPTRGLGLWLFIVLTVVVGIVLGFQHGPTVASLLGTRG